MQVVRLTRAAFRALEALSPWRQFLLIFGVGLTVRMAVSLYTGTYLNLERYEMERVGLSFARTGTLADPYLIPTGSTAHVPPAYAIVLGFIFRIFGTGPGAELVKNFVSSAAASAQYGLLPLICPALGLGAQAGLIAGLAGAFLPIKPSTEIMGDWEATFAGLALALLIYAIAKTWSHAAFTVRRGLVQGVGWGIALLISSGLLTVFVAIAAVGFLNVSRDQRKMYVTYVAASAAIIAVCLAPWALRNEKQLGAPIFTRSNFGLEIHLSNNDLAGPLEPFNYKKGVYDAYHPLQNLSEAEAVRSMGEVAYNRDRLQKGIAWIRTHPRRFMELTAQRFFFTWFPHTTAGGRDVVLWLMTAGAALGLIFLWQSHRTSAMLLLACLVGYTPLFYLIHVSVRHRYPVDWILLLADAYFAQVVINHGALTLPYLARRTESPRVAAAAQGR